MFGQTSVNRAFMFRCALGANTDNHFELFQLVTLTKRIYSFFQFDKFVCLIFMYRIPFQIYVFELGNTTKQQNWTVSRNQPYDDVITTENAVAAFWFTKKEAAENFFENCHHNRFREPCFPTPNGYEAYYVPLQSPPTSREYPKHTYIKSNTKIIKCPSKFKPFNNSKSKV